MDKYIVLAGFILIGIMIFNKSADSGQLTSYTNTTVLNSADTFPVVLSSSNLNGNINWTSLKNIISSGLNWTNIKVIGIQYGDHSGINWQAFGA